MTNEEIIKELSGKTVLEINDLVKALEEAWESALLPPSPLRVPPPVALPPRRRPSST